MRCLLVILCFTATLAPGASATSTLDTLLARFEENLPLLQPAPLALDFKRSLSDYGASRDLREQLAVVDSLVEDAGGIRPDSLQGNERLHLSILDFELALHRERLGHIAGAGSPAIEESLTRISDLEHADFWYAWLLKKWTGTQLTPTQVVALGEQRVAAIKTRLLRLPEVDQVMLSDAARVQTLFESRSDTVAAHLGDLFPEHYSRDFSIARGSNEALANTPGYYDPGTATFHFNLFGEYYDTKDIDWLLLHEATPGHHFQFSVQERLPLASFRQSLWYPGYAEGWAAYVENYGAELGLYRSIPAQRGMLEWNLVRAVRVVLDVRLNRDGWNEDQALSYWQSHINGQDDIGRREIARMLRWPAQVHSYVIGGLLLEQRRDALARLQGEHFDLRAFHTAVLELGPVPMGILDSVLR